MEESRIAPIFAVCMAEKVGGVPVNKLGHTGRRAATAPESYLGHTGFKFPEGDSN